jgi:hypothetical protein
MPFHHRLFLDFVHSIYAWIFDFYEKVSWSLYIIAQLGTNDFYDFGVCRQLFINHFLQK